MGGFWRQGLVRCSVQECWEAREDRGFEDCCRTQWGGMGHGEVGMWAEFVGVKKLHFPRKIMTNQGKETTML